VLKPRSFSNALNMNAIKKVCIIDDDPIFVYGGKILLNRTQFCDEVVVFTNGLDAFDYISTLSLDSDSLPDVILLDINMPVMNGWEFLEVYSALQCATKIPIFIVSSSVDPSDIDKASTFKSVYSFISKPLGREDLASIRNLLQAS